MNVKVKRDGALWEQSYKRGIPQGPVKNKGATRGTGTTIFFMPDTEIFGSKLKFDIAHIRDRMKSKAFLHGGLKLIFIDEEAGTREEFFHEGGIAEYLGYLVQERGKAANHPSQFNVAREDKPRLEISLLWTEATDEYTLSFEHPDDGMSWTMVKGRLQTGQEGRYRLTRLDPAHTAVTYELTIHHNLPLPGFIRNRVIKALVDSTLSGLKQRVEHPG